MFEVVEIKDGIYSIKNLELGEIMHHLSGPWAEANDLYIHQSRLEEKLSSSQNEFIIFDVGLGAMTNALAAMHLITKLKPHQPVTLVSFEKDLSLAQFALDHRDKFPFIKPFEKACEIVLKEHIWKNEHGIVWKIVEGDFIEKVKEVSYKPDLVFFDAYSPKRNARMWSYEVFKNLRDRGSENLTLVTYSRATPVRVALLLAGFYVGVGQTTGLKEETTIASSQLKDLAQPLDHRWFQRWERSDRFMPNSLNNISPQEVKQKIMEHPQFERIHHESH